MSVQAKKSHLEICSAKGYHVPPDRHKISVTTFSSAVCNRYNNNTDNLFDHDLHLNNVPWDARQWFYSKSRERKYRNLILIRLLFLLLFFFFLPNYQDLFEIHVRSSYFVHLGIQRWHNFGMRLVTWLWAVQGLLRPCQVTRRVPLIFVNYIDELRS